MKNVSVTITLVAVGLIMMFATPTFAANNQCHVREGFGRHSGFGGQGGLGRGGYHFGDHFEDNHPRRSEVLGRDNRLNWALNKDYGKLDGQYGALKSEQLSIRQQEQAFAKANGGYITRQEQAQLNQDENQLHQQLRQDLAK